MLGFFSADFAEDGRDCCTVDLDLVLMLDDASRLDDGEIPLEAAATLGESVLVAVETELCSCGLEVVEASFCCKVSSSAALERFADGVLSIAAFRFAGLIRGATTASEERLIFPGMAGRGGGGVCRASRSFGWSRTQQQR